MNIPETLNVSRQGETEILITRMFEAPRHLVFDAHTKPELLKRWLGVRGGWTLAICEIDLKVGGAYRYVWRNESKNLDMGAGGVYREVTPPELLVCTERFDYPWYSGEALNTTVLDEQAGRTSLTLTVRYESHDARETVLKSGMECGLAESYNALAELLAIADYDERVMSLDVPPAAGT
ncbi:MAG TPA: SRPBCC family protein [Bryobacteraceae bacterium]|nr:SRPBCC family protein [Bryobacteraceae bacterium]